MIAQTEKHAGKATTQVHLKQVAHDVTQSEFYVCNKKKKQSMKKLNNRGHIIQYKYFITN